MTDVFEKQYINGEWIASTSDRFLDVINPATFAHFARVPDGTEADVDKAVAAAKAAQPAWAAVPLKDRIALMEKMLVRFRAMRSEIIELEAKELGAPVTYGANAHCDHQFARVRSYIDEAVKVPLEKKLAASTVLREPVGVVACITPWNYPLGQIVQKIVPAVLMGNTVVLKASQHTPLTPCLLVDAFHQAGFPKGVVNMISGRGSKLGHRLSTHPDVDMVSFTGSTSVGITLAQSALESVKRISLELGGKSAFIWLKSKDYRPALKLLFGSIFQNSGQTCTALSRLLVPHEDLAAIERLLVSELPKYPVGDPLDPKSLIGPVASKAQYEKITEYIKLGLKEGARMVAGEVPGNPDHGYYLKPVIFSDVKNSMRIAREEIFGPVLCVIPYDSQEEAVAIANDSIYGLSGAVFGEKKRAIEVAKMLKTGNVYINDAPRDDSAPFGGYKQSGIGREGGVAGMEEFTQLKAIFDHGKL